MFRVACGLVVCRICALSYFVGFAVSGVFGVCVNCGSDCL